MKALIIAAHGSRKKESAMEVARLAQKVRAKSTLDRVVHAFLQFSEPYLPQVIEDLARDGVSEMVIFPFFISAGSHVNQDIPEAVEQARKSYPHIQFKLTRHLGVIDSVEDLILGEVNTLD
ncbi:MAG: CbiX/SirB N-terminal domain-containing protein [Desulfobacterales bacterium]|nr:CbiX/SirB N-terminal domain-containing protein [Desulfobacterales bacterium]